MTVTLAGRESEGQLDEHDWDELRGDDDAVSAGPIVPDAADGDGAVGHLPKTEYLPTKELRV